MKAAVAPNKHLVPNEALDEAIVTLTARINAATYELRVLVRQFDKRAGSLTGRSRTDVRIEKDGF